MGATSLYIARENPSVVALLCSYYEQWSLTTWTDTKGSNVYQKFGLELPPSVQLELAEVPQVMHLGLQHR